MYQHKTDEIYESEWIFNVENLGAAKTFRLFFFSFSRHIFRSTSFPLTERRPSFCTQRKWLLFFMISIQKLLPHINFGIWGNAKKKKKKIPQSLPLNFINRIKWTQPHYLFFAQHYTVKYILEHRQQETNRTSKIKSNWNFVFLCLLLLIIWFS